MEKIIAFVGDNTIIGNKFGKEGTKSDITFYNGKGISAVVPHTYPEKIIPLIQAVEISDFVVVAQEKMDWSFGEILVLLDIMKKPGVFFHTGYEKENIKLFSKETFYRNYDIINNEEELREKINNFKPEEKGFTIIDHFFNVKGVGLVVLGHLKGGETRVYDKKTIYPQKKQITIKSIQVHDKNVDSVSGFSRIGYSLKGIDKEELERGSIITNREMEIKSEFEEIEYNRYSNPLSKGENAMVCFGAQQRTLFVGDRIKINKPAVVYSDGIVFRNDIKERLRILGKIAFNKTM